ncbi:MAG: UPF0280 family protein [Betaproteobacteria bacterium]|nr:UPF0280 family protein [Betaproteobacteria bacterium]NBP38248.1 UPF0280 family protein [Betaproteobacteria bacterium]NBQ79382.1 UPF0280 family protein [Betaproteobacteria bacterium]NBS39924.1 UPF0280 family protein [Betaproteobacteria bacterium]NBT05355.1 UPF0280 family protein [Betaproteobacteria bacterium]
MGPIRKALPGGRLHFAHGPIELVIGADGPAPSVAAAHEAAWVVFQSVLKGLVAELPALRQPVVAGPCPLQGPVARRMWAACSGLPTDFITPMAAVAGAVAQEILAAYETAGMTRAFVNNGGDIALLLTPGSRWRIGLVADITRCRPSLDGSLVVDSHDPVRGVATSGWRGRSHSLGIADSVTVLAATAAEADAAATIVANAVNPQQPDHELGIERAPASSLSDDSDLGERAVTIHVPPLPPEITATALAHGVKMAQTLQRAGRIHAAVLACQGQLLTIEPSDALPRAA